MEIKAEKSRYHKYTFEYEFNLDTLQFCRQLKKKYGWKNFGFLYKKWRFNNPLIIDDIIEKYPETKIEEEIQEEYRKAKIEQKKDEENRQEIERIKQKKNSDIEIKEIKGELFPFQRVAVEFFQKTNGKAILGDVMGCISGTAVIGINRGGNCRKYTMKQVYKRFNGLEKTQKNWKSEIKTRSLNEETGLFELNKIKKVLYKGKKKVIKIKTEGGKELVLTPDHKILSEEGKWIEAEKFNIGDKLFVNGKQICRNCGCDKDIIIYKYAKFKGLCKKCVYKHFRKNPNHISQKNISKDIFIPQKDKITDIIEAGEEDVYDIVMDNPHRNFIANGIVVHNCGKTLESLAYVAHANFSKTLVVCPASVKHSWYNETKKWTYLEPYVIDSKTGLSFETIDKHNIFIINYDILDRFQTALNNIRFDCLIIDECHLIKNSQAKRTKAVKKLSRNVNYTLLLSGTPLLNRPVEIFNSLQIIDPNTWNDWWGFVKKYCNAHQTRFGLDVSGASNIDKLKQNISRYFLRRTKEEVLPDLPQKHFIDSPVEMTGEQKQNYQKLIDSFVKYLRDIKEKKNQEIIKTLQAEHLTKLNELRQLTNATKTEYAKELIKYIIDNGEKVVIFSAFKHSLHQLYSEFSDNAVMITGDINYDERERAIHSFQNDPQTKIFLGGIQSAGVGITLTSGNNIIFIDYSWVPSDHSQAIDRCHRIGQEANQVTIYQLYCENTIDDKMKKMLDEKQQIFDKIFEGSQDEETANINQIIKEIDEEN